MKEKNVFVKLIDSSLCSESKKGTYINVWKLEVKRNKNKFDSFLTCICLMAGGQFLGNFQTGWTSLSPANFGMGNIQIC